MSADTNETMQDDDGQLLDPLKALVQSWKSALSKSKLINSFNPRAELDLNGGVWTVWYYGDDSPSYVRILPETFERIIRRDLQICCDKQERSAELHTLDAALKK
jgi:hypothetical protein